MEKSEYKAGVKLTDKYVYGLISVIMFLGGIQMTITFISDFDPNVGVGSIIFLLIFVGLGGWGTNRMFFSKLVFDGERFQLRDLRGAAVDLPILTLADIGKVSFKKSIYSSDTSINFYQAESVEFILRDGTTKKVGVGRFKGGDKGDLFKALLTEIQTNRQSGYL